MRSYVTGGAPPRSVLADISLDAVFGRHQEAREELQAAARDSVRADLARALGRRKERPLDLDSLQRLPVSELARACRAVRLPASDDPRAMARALHALLGSAPDADGRARGSGAQDWGHQPRALQRADWRHAEEAAAAPGAAGAAAGRGAVGTVRALPAEGHDGFASIGWGTHAGGGTTGDGGADVEDAAAAALDAAAEREADELFEGELQRRLQRATAGVLPSSVDAGAAAAGAGSQGPTEGRSAMNPIGAPSPPPPLQAHDMGCSRAPERQQRHQHHSEQPAGRAARAPLFLTTTERLAASPPAGPATCVPGPRGTSEENRSSDVGLGTGGGAAWAGPLAWAGPVPGAESSPYAPQPSSRPHPSEVYRAVRRCLSRQGYVGKEPRQLRSLMLLRRVDLTWLLRDFCGLSEAELLGQSREQMAARLLQLMAAQPPPPPQPQPPPQPVEKEDDGHAVEQPTAGTGSGDAAAVSSAAATAGAACGGGEPRVGGRGDVAAPASALVGQHPGLALETAANVSQPGVSPPSAGAVEARAAEGYGAAPGEVQEAEAEAALEWDEEAAAMGDPRRREVLVAARRRRQLMSLAAQPEEIASWLVKARAQDVVLIHLPHHQQQQRQQPRTPSSPSPPASSSSPSPGSLSPTASYVLLATGLSQRHAYACAHAVRYQIRERLQELAESEARSSSGANSSDGSGRRAGPSPSSSFGSLDVPGPPAVAGVNGADWLSLEAGNVQVHVMTAQARQYYRLEDLFLGQPAWSPAGAARGEHGSGGGGGGGPQPRVQLFGAAAGERQPETLETARVEAER